MTIPDPINALPLDHVGIAVESIDAVLPAFQAVTGEESSRRDTVESQGVTLVFLGTGDGKLELLEPLAADTAVGRFLERRGPGLHHVAYRVTGINDRLQRLKAEGFELIDEKARPGAFGHQVAFLHPRSTGGVLIELVEP